MEATRLAFLKQEKDQASQAKRRARMNLKRHRKEICEARQHLLSCELEKRAALHTYNSLKSLLWSIEGELKVLRSRRRASERMVQSLKNSRTSQELLSLYFDQTTDLCEEITLLKEKCGKTHEELLTAKSYLKAATRVHEAAKRPIIALKDLCMQHSDLLVTAKRTYNRATSAYQNALAAVRPDLKMIAALAGVPECHLNSARITIKTNGRIDIYFGGDQSENAMQCQGHYIIGENGDILYKREPSLLIIENEGLVVS